MPLEQTCPRCDSGLGEGLDLRKSACHNCGYVDYSPEPEPEPEKATAKSKKANGKASPASDEGEDA